MEKKAEYFSNSRPGDKEVNKNCVLFQTKEHTLILRSLADLQRISKHSTFAIHYEYIDRCGNMALVSDDFKNVTERDSYFNTVLNANNINCKGLDILNIL